VLRASARNLAGKVKRKDLSATELVEAHLRQIERVNPAINAVLGLLSESALREAAEADRKQAAGELLGPLHGVPFSVKDSIAIAGARCTAGTKGRETAPFETEDATLVRRLREAGGIPIAQTNLPDLLFSFETDNLICGRTNNPYDLTRTCGGSSGGEAALIASCGSPLGLGSDAFGSVRLPAAFCGIAGIKPTSGRLPRTGHVPPAGSWLERVWQIGPMARYTSDLELAMRLLAGEDGRDFTAPPVPLQEPKNATSLRIGFFTDNGFAHCSAPVKQTVESAAAHLAGLGHKVVEAKPPNVERAYEIEMTLAGADGAKGIDSYLEAVGSVEVHPYQTDFVNRLRAKRCSLEQFAETWAAWDRYRSEMVRFFDHFDAVVSPVYTQAALPHGASTIDVNFAGFSYTMAWNVAGFPAATVRSGSEGDLPLNVQVIAAPWHDLTTLSVCQQLEQEFGGWQPSSQFSA
jgi:amidase